MLHLDYAINRHLPMNNKMDTCRGIALVTGLIFLLILSLIAISAMKNSVLDYKISSHNSIRQRVFTQSEEVQSAVGEAIRHYFITNRDWTAVTLAENLTRSENFIPTSGNQASENPLDTNSLASDFQYTQQKNVNDGIPETITTDVYVLNGQTQFVPMSGLTQLSGYSGFGKSAANGGTNTLYEIRSRSRSDSGIERISYSRYLSIPGN